MDDTTGVAAPDSTRSPHGARRLLDHPLLGSAPAADAVAFSVDDRAMIGRAGDTILAALLAAGLRVCRTMPRAGEPRGGYCLVGRCADCLMTVDGAPNVRTCVTPLRDGMRVSTQQGLGAWAGAAPHPAAIAEGVDG